VSKVMTEEMKNKTSVVMQRTQKLNMSLKGEKLQAYNYYRKKRMKIENYPISTRKFYGANSQTFHAILNQQAKSHLLCQSVGGNRIKERDKSIRHPTQNKCQHSH